MFLFRSRLLHFKAILPRWCCSLVKLKPDNFSKMVTAEMQLLWEMFHKHKYELRFAGGVVRDLLLNKCPLDIDFATTATTSQMKQMFLKEGIRVLNTKGEKHGTISVRVNDKVNFEITTLRVLIPSPDGNVRSRFVQDWSTDAKGRDLTINSMFLDFDGTIYDYTNGVQDLENRKIAFVEDPSQRIQEDYLRILRYFRFHGQLAPNPQYHDSNVLAAIKENGPNLSKISGERIWTELKKILSVNHTVENVTTMINLGLFPYIGFPEKSNVEEFKKVSERSSAFNPQLMTRVSSLLNSEEEVNVLDNRLKLSTNEFDLIILIVNYRNIIKSANPLKHLQHLIFDHHDTGICGNTTKVLFTEVAKYHGNSELLEKLQNWEIPKFPITGTQLIKNGIEKGPQLKINLDILKAFWKESNFSASENELLNLVKP